MKKHSTLEQLRQLRARGGNAARQALGASKTGGRARSLRNWRYLPFSRIFFPLGLCIDNMFCTGTGSTRNFNLCWPRARLARSRTLGGIDGKPRRSRHPRASHERTTNRAARDGIRKSADEKRKRKATDEGRIPGEIGSRHGGVSGFRGGGRLGGRAKGPASASEDEADRIVSTGSRSETSER